MSSPEKCISRLDSLKTSKKNKSNMGLNRMHSLVPALNELRGKEDGKLTGTRRRRAELVADRSKEPPAVADPPTTAVVVAIRRAVAARQRFAAGRDDVQEVHRRWNRAGDHNWSRGRGAARSPEWKKSVTAICRSETSMVAAAVASPKEIAGTFGHRLERRRAARRKWCRGV